MNERKKGYVYVLTNPSFRDDWVKIGKSAREPEVRGRELYNTAVPLPYEIYATLKTEKYVEAEKMLHRTIDRISKLRIAANREFFNIAPEIVYEILLDVANMLNDAEVSLYGDNVQVTANNGPKERKKMSARFDFYKRGIMRGLQIVFVGDETYKAIVENEREVIFEGELWYLSPLVRELYTRLGTVNSSGSYQGPLFFKYNGVRLTDIPEIKVD
ncbi:MAG: GIY-YIG nuclease family protein [Bacilli bacterium]|nr:GIY-YIG nuclease family protein [Bacilli bacterium]